MSNNTEMINILTDAVTGLQSSPNSADPMYTSSIAEYKGLIHLLRTGLCFSKANFLNQVIKAILAKGYVIDVHDGVSFCLQHATDHAGIVEALNSTGWDCLWIDNADNDQIGWIEFIYDNGAPENCIADYSRNEETKAIVAALYKRHFDI